MRPEQNTAVNPKAEQFITAKISDNAFKQRSGIHSVLYVNAVHNRKNIRLRIETVEQNTLNVTTGQITTAKTSGCSSRRIAVEQKRNAAGMVETQDWKFETCLITHELRMRITYAKKLIFVLWLLNVQLLEGREQMRVCLSRYDQSAWTAN